LDLSASPIVIQPGKVRVIYVHSSLPGDEAIVYDNTANNIPWAAPGPPRFEDNFISIHTGKAHLSPIPFNQSPIWGWGNAWVRSLHADRLLGSNSRIRLLYFSPFSVQRDRREFVGQINYGVTYKLWNPERHNLFGTNFHKATESVLALQRRYESPMSLLPDECVYYILNMCRWDWFEDDGRDMKRRARIRKQRLRALEAEQQEQGDATMHDAENISNEEDDGDEVMEAAHEGAPAQGWAMQLVQQQLGLDADDSDDDDEEEAEEDDESDEESVWERANGYRADNVAFSFRDVSSDEESDAEDDDEEEQNVAPARQNWLRGQLGRIHVPHFSRRQPAVVDSDSDDSDFEP